MDTIYIDTEHTQGTESQTRMIICQLLAMGWDVDYGSGPRWQFEDDHQRSEFEYDFDKAMESVIQ
jgi:hypothetical protein